MKLKTAAIVAVFALGGTALAHADVSNPAVKERMELMGDVRSNFAVIGSMVQGRTDFDATAAAEAQAGLAAAAALIPEKFEAEESDPESEASPAIWENWEDFAALAGQLEQASLALETDSLDSLKAGFGAIGASCGGCHQKYRID